MVKGSKFDSVFIARPDEESGLIIVQLGDDSQPFGVDPDGARGMARLLFLAALHADNMRAKRAAQGTPIAQPPSAAAMKLN